MSIVTRRLGSASGQLYARLVALLEYASEETPTRAAIRRIIIELLCGAYHDYRSDAPLPKGDLLIALQAVPYEPMLEFAMSALRSDVIAGKFDEDASESKRWADHLVDAKTAHRRRTLVEYETPKKLEYRAIEIGPRQREVLDWLCTYIERRGESPTISEIGAGVGMNEIVVLAKLNVLNEKGLVANVGGARGWSPMVRTA